MCSASARTSASRSAPKPAWASRTCSTPSASFCPRRPTAATSPPRALIFDSQYDDYRGVICYVRVFSGTLKVRQKIRLMGTGSTYQITELGKFRPDMKPVDQLGTGEVGYVIANIRRPRPTCGSATRSPTTPTRPRTP